MEHIRYAYMGTQSDCELVANKCKNCSVEKCDFYFIYKLHDTASDLLGPIFPGDMKKNMRNKEVIIYDDPEPCAFCEFHVSKRRQYTAVYCICTAESARRRGIALKFLQFLEQVYKLPIKAVCITNSASEAFWSKVAKKVGTKYSKKGTELSIYIRNTITEYQQKEDLF